jgi:citrate lyase alpha subunit
MWQVGFLAKRQVLMVVFGVLDEERLKWQEVGMKAVDIDWMEEAAKALKQEPVKLEFLEKALAPKMA